MSELDLELLRRAIQAIEKAASATSGSEKYRLLDEALRLYREARDAGDYSAFGNELGGDD